jgi:hypothetical protein
MPTLNISKTLIIDIHLKEKMKTNKRAVFYCKFLFYAEKYVGFYSVPERFLLKSGRNFRTNQALFKKA